SSVPPPARSSPLRPAPRAISSAAPPTAPPPPCRAGRCEDEVAGLAALPGGVAPALGGGLGSPASGADRAGGAGGRADPPARLAPLRSGPAAAGATDPPRDGGARAELLRALSARRDPLLLRHGAAGGPAGRADAPGHRRDPA